MSYSLGKKSKQKLDGVHEDIVAVVELAISKSEYDFTVLEGLRSVKRQKELVDTGKSTTMNSRHLNGHAVDIAPWPISWEWEDYYPIAKVIKEAAEELNVDFEWGGDWKTFPDAPHWQLSWRKYP
jgi:peptidoglycan L-alanyl-D-glutamate endopeptidase CwlK